MTGEEIALAILKSGSGVSKIAARQLAQEHLDLLSRIEWKVAETESPKESGYYQTTHGFMKGYAHPTNVYFDARTNHWSANVDLWLPYAKLPEYKK